MASVEGDISKFCSSCDSHVSLLTVLARGPYLAFVEDRDMNNYFLVFHEMSDSLRKIQKHVTDLCVSVHATQSKSKKACRPMAEFEGNNTPVWGWI